MAFDNPQAALRFEPADYRVRLFLSADLSGSTAFKNSTAGEARENGASPKWVTVFQSFYTDFPARYSSNFQQQANRAVGNDSCPVLWKAVGDELVFCGRVSNKHSLTAALNAFINTLIDYRKSLMDAGLDLNLKGAGWLAAFPEPNRAVQLRRNDGSPDHLSASEALERAADERPFEYDFLGKAIDTGFRVASKAQPDRFVLSVQLARLLASAPRGLGFGHDLYLDHPIELKGVNKGVPYPVLYIDTLEHLAVAKIRGRERQLLAGNALPQRDDLAAYLAAYCEVAGTDEIMLPMDLPGDADLAPDSYRKHRELIAEHLRQEKDREYSEPAGGEDASGGSDAELPPDDDIVPVAG